MTNDRFYTITTNDSPNSDGFHTVPAYTVETGTISTTNTFNGTVVNGTSTLFLTEVPRYSWLAAVTSKEARAVTAIQDNTTLYVLHQFDSNLAAAKVLVIPRLSPKRIILKPRTGASGTIQGIAFTAGQTYEYVCPDNQPRLDPIQIVMSGGVMEVQIDY